MRALKPTVLLLLVVLIAPVAGLPVWLADPSLALAVEIGERAPDFALPSTTGEKISLSQFTGKKAVLLEFYGGDFAPQ